VVAVEDLHPVAGQGVRVRPAHLPDERRQPLGGVPDQLPAGVGADPGEPGVDGGDGHRDAVVGPVGGVDRRPDPADDGRHEIDAGGEEELAVSSGPGGPVEEGVEVAGVEGVLQRAADGDGQRALLEESFDHGVQKHEGSPPRVT
jgi:hypothetical protein